MNLQYATDNIGQVLQTGRIMLLQGPLNAQELGQLQSDFGALVRQAQSADALEKKVAELEGNVKVLEARLKEIVIKKAGSGSKAE